MNTSEVALAPELATQVKLVTRLEKRSSKAKEELAVARAHLLLICTHPDTEPRTEHFSGSYYDTAYTEYFTRCKICGATSERTRNSHRHYG